MRIILLLTYGFIAVRAVQQRYGAVPDIPDGFSPRYILSKSNPIAKRADGCNANSHNCLDIGFPNKCCENDSYCFVDKAGEPKCCPIGSNCPNSSFCSSTAYWLITTYLASGASTSTTRSGCYMRKCPETSLYLCAKDLGGNCCAYGSECRADGNCTRVKTESGEPRNTVPAEGCSTAQYKCADGTGCCDNWKHCTQVTGMAYCAPGNPTNTDLTISKQPSGSGLSDAAKAGIAVGAVVGVSTIIGAAIWLCLSKRRLRRQQQHEAAQQRPPYLAGDDLGSSGRDRAMTEVSDARHPPMSDNSGLARDYFGPEATTGPYTETVLPTSPVPGRAVPSAPRDPGDIAAPVEIGSNTRTGDSGLLSPISNTSIYVTLAQETIDGRHELHGSERPPRRSASILSAPITPLSDGGTKPVGP